MRRRRLPAHARGSRDDEEWVAWIRGINKATKEEDVPIIKPGQPVWCGDPKPHGQHVYGTLPDYPRFSMTCPGVPGRPA